MKSLRASTHTLQSGVRYFSMSSLLGDALKQVQNSESLQGLEVSGTQKVLIEQGTDKALSVMRMIENKVENEKVDVSVCFSVGVISVTFSNKYTPQDMYADRPSVADSDITRASKEARKMIQDIIDKNKKD